MISQLLNDEPREDTRYRCDRCGYPTSHDELYALENRPYELFCMKCCNAIEDEENWADGFVGSFAQDKQGPKGAISRHLFFWWYLAHPAVKSS